MAFVNDKPSKEEIEKYDLDTLWNRYHRGAYIYLPDRDFEHSWTVDREREIWLYDMTCYHHRWRGMLYLLHYKGKLMEMGITYDSDTSSYDLHFTKEVIYLEEEERSEYYDLPFEYGVKENFTDEESLKEINNVFKDALISRNNHRNNITNYRW